MCFSLREHLCSQAASQELTLVDLGPWAAQNGLMDIKAPVGYDCRDPFNLALLENWLNSLCPAV